jgi:hypothetical protein
MLGAPWGADQKAGVFGRSPYPEWRQMAFLSDGDQPDTPGEAHGKETTSAGEEGVIRFLERQCHVTTRARRTRPPFQAILTLPTTGGGVDPLATFPRRHPPRAPNRACRLTQRSGPVQGLMAP